MPASRTIAGATPLWQDNGARFSCTSASHSHRFILHPSSTHKQLRAVRHPSIMRTTDENPARVSLPPPLPQGTLSLLDEEHRRTFRRALLNILSTDLAESTYAQILDGLPTAESLRRSWSPLNDHPVHALDHTEVCDGSLERARNLRLAIDFSLLRFDIEVRATKYGDADTCANGEL